MLVAAIAAGAWACGGDATIAMVDASRDLDAGADASPIDSSVRDTGIGAPIDAARADAAPDAGRTLAGECTVVPQTGCESGEACRRVLVGGEPAAQCRPAGTIADGEECTVSAEGDPCGPGLVCSSSQCVPYCRTSEDDCTPLRGYERWCRPDAAFPELGRCTAEPRP